MHLLASTKQFNFNAFDNSSILYDDVDSRSSDSTAMLAYWNKTTALIGGIETMRDAGDTYIPKFAGENKDDHAFRLKVAKLTNIYRDILEGLSSKPFEKEIVLKEGTTPTEIVEFSDNVDGSGNNLSTFASTTFYNGINNAIDWIFIDYPVVDKTSVKTRKDEKIAGISPFWSHVLGINVLDAKSKVVGKNEVLTYIKILEPGEPDHIREFEIDENNKVIWKLYEKQTDNVDVKENKWKIIDNGILTIDVIPLVPFSTGRRNGKGFRFYPAMQDAVDLQINLYQQESALEFTKILTAYPMLTGNGVKPEKTSGGDIKPVKVGPAQVLYAPANDQTGSIGSWGYIEPSGASLSFLAGDIKETKADLRELGRQPLTAQSGNLTVISSAVAASKSKSAVVAWALNLQNAIKNALIITGKLFNLKDFKPDVDVYTDFDNFLQDGSDLDFLAKLNSDKKLSTETLWAEAQRRNTLSPDFDASVEHVKISTEAYSEIPGDDPPNENDELNEEKENGNENPN